MDAREHEEELAREYLRRLLEATFPLQDAPDREIALHALIRAAELLKARIEQELAELRQEMD